MFRRLVLCLSAVVLFVQAPAGAASAPPDPGLREGPRPALRVPFPAIKDFSSLSIRLQRTPCYGWCPSYSVEITGDGTVNYFGERYVETKGAATAKIPLEKVRALFQAFVAADFFWTFDEYRAPVTDLPTQILTISFDGHSKTVEDYAGGHIGMPKVIDDLEEAVDAAAGTQQWVGKSRQP